MATSKPKIKVGDMACPMCSRSVRVMQNFDRHGALGFPCTQGCDFPGWAKEGTEAFDIAVKRMGVTWLPPKATKDELPAQKATAPDKEAPKKAPGFFS
jgi:hypothetical protein